MVSATVLPSTHRLASAAGWSADQDSEDLVQPGACQWCGRVPVIGCRFGDLQVPRLQESTPVHNFILWCGGSHCDSSCCCIDTAVCSSNPRSEEDVRPGLAARLCYGSGGLCSVGSQHSLGHHRWNLLPGQLSHLMRCRNSRGVMVFRIHT